MFDYQKVMDPESFRMESFAGYFDEFERCVYDWPASMPFMVTTLVEYLLNEKDSTEIQKTLDELKVTVSGERSDRIDFAVYENSALVPLAHWLSSSGLQAGDSVYLHPRFRFVLSDVSETFELDASAVIENVLPYYEGYLHAWLDAVSVRRAFPQASRRMRNFYAHHVLDYLEHGVRKYPEQMSEAQLRAREYLLEHRKHVVRHILVSKTEEELSRQPDMDRMTNPFEFIEADLYDILDVLMRSAPSSFLESQGSPILRAMDLQVSDFPVPIRRFARITGPRLVQLLKFPALTSALYGVMAFAGEERVNETLEKMEVAKSLSW